MPNVWIERQRGMSSGMAQDRGSPAKPSSLARQEVAVNTLNPRSSTVICR